MTRVARKIPYTPPTTWDTGPEALARVGDVDQIVAEFRRWIFSRSTGISGISAAKMAKMARTFLASGGYGVHLEDAILPDPVTGKPGNPNGVKRRRHRDQVEKYRDMGHITARQAEAGKKLRDAWEGVMRSPPAIKKVNVDTSSKPDQHIAILVDRIGAYHAIARHVRPEHAGIIDHVVLNNRSVGGRFRGRRHAAAMAALASALDDLADGIG